MKIFGYNFYPRLFFGISIATLSIVISLSMVVLPFSVRLHQAKLLAKSEDSPARELSFIAVGDIMLSRNVARHAELSGNTNWMWANILPYLQSADFVFGNLESPTNGTEKYSYAETMVFNAPTELIKTLPGANFTVLNIANNHALDQGETGLTTTQTLLENLRITTVGTGSTMDEAWKPRYYERNGIKIAFIGASYTSYNDNGSGKSNSIARMQDLDRLKKSVAEAVLFADFIVVTMHGGTEYTTKPTKLQVDFAHTAIDAGADIVIGAHPHWVQSVEEYKGKNILYSLGNFVFDQEWSLETKRGLTAKIMLKKEHQVTTLESIEYHPVIIENYGQPRLDETEQLKQ